MANILVTGANGFLGRRLCELWNPEDRIIKVDLYGDVDYVNDLTNLESFQKIVCDAKPDLIIHLAALSNSIGLPDNQDARALIGVNVLSTFVVQYVAEQENITDLIIAGSMAEYGSTPLKEEPPSESELIYAKPTEAYALSKKIGAALFQSEVAPCKILRFANLYGPGQKDKVISKIIMTAIHGGTFYISGNGQSTRQYLYVDDAVEAIKKVYESSNSRNVFLTKDLNIGPKKETSLLYLMAHITYEFGFQLADLGLTRKSMNTITIPNTSPPDRICMDSSLAYNLLGWEPQVSLEEGLHRTIKAAIEEYYGDC